ncbi:LytR/AlgR family response regulator transcription factor [Colwelliaceae bacterium 6441]
MSKELKQLILNSYFAWLVYFFVFNIYCIFWREYAIDLEYSFIDSFIWWVKEWSMWLLFTPLLLVSVEHSAKKLSLMNTTLLLGFASLILAIGCRILIDYQEYTINLPMVIVSLLPKYTVTFLIIMLSWYLKVFSHNTKTFAETDEQSKAQSIVVEHRGLSVDIAVKDIYSIVASGNYVEIYCQNDMYIKRATLKQLLDILPATTFMQVHRSHIVNVAKIARLNNTETGAGLITLMNNRNLPVSKTYKPELKRFLI